MSLSRPTGSGRARLLSRSAKVLTAVTGLATLGGWPARGKITTTLYSTKKRPEVHYKIPKRPYSVNTLECRAEPEPECAGRVAREGEADLAAWSK